LYKRIQPKSKKEKQPAGAKKAGKPQQTPTNSLLCCKLSLKNRAKTRQNLANYSKFSLFKEIVC
jgi:hypothetical protein